MLKYMNEFLNKLNSCKSVKDLIDIIPIKFLSLTSLIVLCYLCLIPYISSLTYSFGTVVLYDGLTDLLSTKFSYCDHWYRLQWTVLILSLLFIGYSFAKAYYSGLSLKEWIKKHKAVSCFGVVLVLAFISFLLSSNHQRSFFGTGYRHDGLLSYIMYLGVFCMAIWLNDKHRRILCEVFMTVGCIMGLLLIFPCDLFTTWGSGTYATVFCQYTHFGSFMSMCIPCGMYLFLTDKGGLIRMLRIAQVWLLFNTMMVNATRATAVAVGGVFILINVWGFMLDKSKRKAVIVLDILLVLTVIFLNTDAHLSERAKDNLDVAEQIVLRENGGSDIEALLDRLTSYRYTMWKKAVGYSLEKPLFGWGPDNLGELYYADGLSFTDRPHNEFIQIGASLGIPCLIMYCLGLINWLIDMFKKKDIICIVCIGYLICSVFSNSMFYTTPYFYMFLGLTYGIINK